MLDILQMALRERNPLHPFSFTTSQGLNSLDDQRDTCNRQLFDSGISSIAVAKDRYTSRTETSGVRFSVGCAIDYPIQAAALSIVFKVQHQSPDWKEQPAYDYHCFTLCLMNGI